MSDRADPEVYGARIIGVSWPTQTPGAPLGVRRQRVFVVARTVSGEKVGWTYWEPESDLPPGIERITV